MPLQVRLVHDVVIDDAERPDAAALTRVEQLLGETRSAVRNARQVQSMRELVIKDDTAHCFIV